MYLTNLAIKRPLIVLIAVGVLLAFGLLSLTRLGVELLPVMDVPIVTITTPYPGAGPDAVDTLVTQKIEDAVAGLSEIDNIQAISVEGVSTVTVNLTEKAPKDSAQQIERRVNAIRGDLPTDTKAPIVDKLGSGPQLVLALELGGNRGLDQLQRIAEDNLKKAIEVVPGVARVDLSGGMEREIQVQVDQQRLQSHGISILQVTQALAGDNLSVPAGNVTQRDKDWTIRLNSQAQSLADLQAIPLASGANGTVRVRDVAVVVDTHKQMSLLQRANGNPALALMIYKQASANTVTVSQAVRSALPRMQESVPAGVSITVEGDAAPYITSSVADVQHELMLAVLLTGLVLLVFLHTLPQHGHRFTGHPDQPDLDLWGDEPARDQLQLHEPDGPRSDGRDPGRRLDRGAREHRSPPQAGRDSAAGGGQRPLRNRHGGYRDHPGRRGGVHAGSIHERLSRRDFP